jgi:carboxymethylenebutenolidase
MGTLVEIETPDGPADAYLAGGEGRPGVLFYMDAIGLRPRIEDMADRIASWGYAVLAPNVFHRDGRAAELAPTEDLRQPANRKAFFPGAMARVRALTPARSNPDAGLWMSELLAHTAGERVAVTGYCMGARLAVRTTALFPDTVVACGGFHGGGLATDDADSPHRVLGNAHAEFLFGHADHDPSMPRAAVERLGAALDAAGLTATNEVYAGAAHGYTMADTDVYDEAATERHFAELEALLARTL